MSYDRFTQQAAWQTNLPATPSATAIGTTLTASGTPHAKGSWSSILTATRDIYGFTIAVTGVRTTATDVSMMFDVALGASQDNVVISEFPVGAPGALNTESVFQKYFPIFVPRGVQVSARIQALIASDTCEFGMWANSGASRPPGPLFSRCDPYGTTAASTTCTSHTAGNSGAESTPANIGSTLSANYGAIHMGVLGIGTNYTAAGYHFELEGVGISGAAEWAVAVSGGESVVSLPAVPFYVSLPAGTQLQVKGECSGTGEALGISFHCFR